MPYEGAGQGSQRFPLCLPPPQLLLSTGVLHTRGKRVMFTRLTVVGTKDPLFPIPRRHTPLDVCVLPPPPSHRDTYSVAVRLAVSGSGSQKEHLIHLQIALLFRTKKLKGDGQLFLFTEASINVLTFCCLFFSHQQK